MKKFICVLLFLSSCDIVNNENGYNPVLIILTFDDGDKSIYELAFPIMKRYGYPGVNFIPSGLVNKPGMMTLEQLHILEKNGWETGGHTVTHANLTTISLDSANYEIQKNYEQLVEWGLKHNCFALPGGHSNPDVNRIIKKYFHIIRTSQNEKYTYPLNLDRLGYYQVQNNDDAKSLLLRISHGIVEGECLIIFGFHKFTEGGADFITEIHVSVFKEFIDEIKKRNLEVVTLSEAVERIHSFGKD